MQGEADTENFDVEFTNEPVVDTPPETSQIEAKFQGFTYVERASHMGDD